MEQNKKMGRPSQDKVRMSLTLDRGVAEYIKSLPDGERSKFANGALAEKIEKIKEQQKFFTRLEGKSNE